MNLDSDMLLVEDYFERVTDDLDTTRLVCDSPIVSGLYLDKFRITLGHISDHFRKMLGLCLEYFQIMFVWLC